LLDGGATKFHLHAYPALGSPLFSFSFYDDEVFDVAFDNKQEWVSFPIFSSGMAAQGSLD
jgi:hypothetical protein